MIIKVSYFITSSLDEVFDFFMSVNTDVLEPNEEIIFPKQSFDKFFPGSTFTLNTKLYNKIYPSIITVKSIIPKSLIETYQEDPNTTSTMTIYFKEINQRIEITQIINIHFKGFYYFLWPLIWPLTWPNAKRLIKRRTIKIIEKTGNTNDKKSILIRSLLSTIFYFLFLSMIAVLSFFIARSFKN